MTPTWDDPAWWTLDNAGLDGIIGLDQEPVGAWRVLFYTSEDGERWTESPLSPLAWYFSSLGLISNDVGLAVTGVITLLPQGQFIESAGIYALATTDLETWSLRLWRVDALDIPGDTGDTAPTGEEPTYRIVDPQFELGRAWPRAWYYRTRPNAAAVRGAHGGAQGGQPGKILGQDSNTRPQRSQAGTQGRAARRRQPPKSRIPSSRGHFRREKTVCSHWGERGCTWDLLGGACPGMVSGLTAEGKTVPWAGYWAGSSPTTDSTAR